MTTGRENGSTGEGVREQLIDRLLPRFEAQTLSTVMVDAGTEQTYRAVRARDAQASPSMALLVPPERRISPPQTTIGPKPLPAAARGARPTTGTAGLTIEGMTFRSGFTPDEARAAGERIGIDWGSAPFDIEQFRMGMDVELEHGARDPQTNVTDDDLIMTAKIARAHLNEFPDYYTRLAKMEAEAEAEANGSAQGE